MSAIYKDGKWYGKGGGDTPSIQLTKMPTPDENLVGTVVEYIGNTSKDYAYSTENFSGEGIADNYVIESNNLRLLSMRPGYGKIRCTIPFSNKGILKVVRQQTHDGGVGYAGLQLGSTLGAEDIYVSSNDWRSGIDVKVTDEIDLSQYEQEEIYLSFRINVSSGNTAAFLISFVVYESVNPNFVQGRFYECKEDYFTGEFYWDEILPDIKFMPSSDMPEVASPMPSVMSRRMKYSTEEQIIGEWVDGKPLYQKTVSSTTSSTAGTNKVVTTLSSDIKLHSMEGLIAGIVPINYPTSGNYYSRCFVSGNSLYIVVGGYLNMAVDITLQYTKTTD